MKKWLWAGLILFGACGLLGALVIFVTGVGPYDLPPAARSLDAELARGRKLGLPMVQDDLKLHVPKEQNAALIITPILHDQSPLKGISKIASDYDKGVAGSEAAARKILAAGKKDLDLVVATKLPKWEIDRDYDDGMHLQFPEYALIKDVAKALALRARVSAKEGRTAAAIADLEAVRRLSMWISQDPTLIGMLVAIAQEAIVFRSYELIATQWRRNPAALDMLRASLKNTTFPLTMERAYRGEYYFALSTGRNLQGFGGIRALADPDSTPSVPKDWKPVREGKPRGLMERAMLASALKLHNDTFEEYKTKGWNTRGVGLSVQKRIDKVLDENKMSYMLASILFPLYSQADNALYKRVVQEELTGKLLDARLVKARTGNWPAITGVDIFSTGDSYKSSASGDFIRIWSVGPNGADEGGSLTNTKDDDLVVASPR